MSIEAMHQALNALEYHTMQTRPIHHTDKAIEALRQAIEQAEKQEPEQVSGDTSDGYHTFNELYEFRKAYNAALFNEWAASNKYSVHKSKRHFDGEDCFGGGWFIVVAQLPDGQISNHYEMKDWDKFLLPETDKAMFEYDNHTGADVLQRLFSLRQALAKPEQEPVAWEYQEYRSAFMGNLQWFDTVQFVQPPNDPELFRNIKPLYTAPPRKKWVGLTELEIAHGLEKANLPAIFSYRAAAKAGINAFKEKNT